MVYPSSGLTCLSSGNALVYEQAVRNVVMNPKGGVRKRRKICANGKDG
jgi:hypothetical protein